MWNSETQAAMSDIGYNAHRKDRNFCLETRVNLNEIALELLEEPLNSNRVTIERFFKDVKLFWPIMDKKRKLSAEGTDRYSLRR